MITEILTQDGWRLDLDITKSDKIVTLNTLTGFLEYSTIKNVIKYDYSGYVYNHFSRTMNFRFTEDHNVTLKNKNSSKYINIKARELPNACLRKFIKSGILKQNKINLTHDQIRLLVQIAADGSLHNKSLCRIIIEKERKKDNVRNILTSLKIEFRELYRKNGSTSFNFTIPSFLSKLELKPISSIITEFNESQFDVLVDEYSKSDGCRNNNSVVIFTSKADEVNRISMGAVINGYSCSIHSRDGHGFSKQTSYQLNLTKRDSNILTKMNCDGRVTKEAVLKEPFISVETDNGNCFVRKMGKIYLA